jgi:hypothetical protein
MHTATAIAPETSVIAARRQAAADRLGVDVDRVRVVQQELRTMREAGILIDVDFHGSSMLRAKATHTEAGISADDMRAERIRMGTKDLFPEHAPQVRSIENGLRHFVETNTTRVPAFGHWVWLAWTNYEHFVESYEEFVERLEAVKQDAIRRYDEIREENRRWHERAAERAWRSIASQYAPDDKVVILTDDRAEFTLEQKDRFVEWVVQKALSKMPLPRELEHGIYIEYQTSILYSDAELAADEAALEQAKSEAARARAAAAEASRRVFDVESQKRYEEAQRKARIAAYQAAELERAREQLARMSSPILDALSALDETIHEAVSRSLESLRKHGGFKGRGASKLARLFPMWKRLNGGVLNDAELEVELKELDELMRSYQAAGDKDVRDAQVGDIMAQLAEIAAMTSEATRETRRKGTSRAAALEL